MTVEIISEDEGALHQQLQLHQVPQPVEAQQVLLRLPPEEPGGESMLTSEPASLLEHTHTLPVQMRPREAVRLTGCGAS